MSIFNKKILTTLLILISLCFTYSQNISFDSFEANRDNDFKIPINIENTAFNHFNLVISYDENLKIEDLITNSNIKDITFNIDKTKKLIDIKYNGKLVNLKKETLLTLIFSTNETVVDKELLKFNTVDFYDNEQKLQLQEKLGKATIYKWSPTFNKDTIVFGLLMLALGFVFYTESRPSGPWHKFYKIVPGLFMAYMIPAILTTLNLISPDWETLSEGREIIKHKSNLYYVASRYLLPAALVLMTLSIDLKGVFNLGWKALIMFFTGTIGIVIGGPIAILVVSMFSPETVGGAGPDAVWRGLSTLAGSWIGGGANQTAMLEIYGYNQKLYGGMVFVDIVVANIWMAILLIGIGKSKRIDAWLNADTTAIEDLKAKVSSFSEQVKRNPSLTDLMLIGAIAFGTVSLAHLGSNFFAELFTDIVAGIESQTTKNIFTFLTSKFFWMISIATIIAIGLSFTKAREFEGAGASKYGSVFIYILVATIGMKMDLTMIFDNLGLIAIGLIWMSIHALLLILVAKLIKAPYFFLAVGSQANVGGAASAPIVASAFHPSLATVGVLLAVFGYAIGTIAAIGCTILMELASAGA